MTRHAILIEASNLQGEQELPGARIDVQNWRTLLSSNLGGAWNSSEITILSKPTWAKVSSTLRAIQSHDYAFISFSGHGYHPQGKDLDESMVCLNETEDVPVRSLNPGNPRCTIVIDSCRKIVTQESMTKMVAASASFSTDAADRGRYRELFDRAAQQGERGAIRLHSCDVDEAAGESSRTGGYYSKALVDACAEWHAKSNGLNVYLPANHAHAAAARTTTARMAQQHPQYDGGRRQNHFPLAVKP